MSSLHSIEPPKCQQLKPSNYIKLSMPKPEIAYCPNRISPEITELQDDLILILTKYNFKSQYPNFK